MGHRDFVRTVEFSPDGTRVVTGSFDGAARVWDANSGVPLGPPLEHGQSVDGVMFSPDGSTILTASADSTARIWRVADGTPLSIPVDGLSRFDVVSFSRDGTKVLATWKRAARVWDAQTGEPITPALVHSADIRSAVLDPSARRVITAAGDGTVCVWEIAKPSAPTHVFAVPGASLAKIAGEHIVVASGTQASLYNATTGEWILGPIEHGAKIEVLEFSPNGERFLTIGGKKVEEWDARSGAHLRGPWMHRNVVKEAHYAPVGDRVLAIAGVEVRVWPTAADGDPIMHRDLISSATFDPAGTRILTSSYDDTARIWDAATNKPIGLPMQHDGDVWTAAWSPDGARIVTGSSDETARVWDAGTGQPLAPPMWHSGTVDVAFWSPQGERILTPAGDGLAIWDAPLDQRPPAMWSMIANRYGASRPLNPSQLGPLNLGERHALSVAAELSRASNLLASALAALPHQVHLAREHATAALNAFRSAHHIADADRTRWALAVIAAIDGDLAAARHEVEADAPADQSAFVTALAQFAAFELARPNLAIDILECLPPVGGPGAVDASLIYLAAHRYAKAARLANGARSGVVDRRRRLVVEAVAWAAQCLATNHGRCQVGDALTAAYEQLRDGDACGERFPALTQALRVDRMMPAASDTVLRVLAILAEPKHATAVAELRSIVTAGHR
jgi:WD40 repeat protein